MKGRCLNLKSDHQKYYRERGITVCKRWKEDFSFFLQDMGERPEGTTLDRKDNSKGYSKSNCRWATATEQMNNRRCNINIKYKGQIMSLKKWCLTLRLRYGTIYNRVKILNWDPKRALEELIEIHKRKV